MFRRTGTLLFAGLLFVSTALAPAPARGQSLLMDTLVFDSAEIDYSGVELLMRFKIAVPGTYSHPYLSDVVPELEDSAQTAYPLTPKGGNFEVVEGGGGNDVLRWTLRYRIDTRVTHDKTGFNVSWSGGPLAIDDSPTPPELPNKTDGSGSESVTNRSRVDGDGWTHPPSANA